MSLESRSVIGPNVKRLVIERSVQLQMERVQTKFGSAGVGEVAAWMAADNGAGMVQTMKDASKWVQDALRVVRAAPDAGEMAIMSDEQLAGMILEKAAAKRAEQKAGARQ